MNSVVTGVRIVCNSIQHLIDTSPTKHVVWAEYCALRYWYRYRYRQGIDILLLIFTPVFNPSFLSYYPSYGRNIVLCDTGIDIGIAGE